MGWAPRSATGPSPPPRAYGRVTAPSAPDCCVCCDITPHAISHISFLPKYSGRGVLKELVEKRVVAKRVWAEGDRL